MRPGRHGASELHARPTQPEPRTRLTSVLGAADVPVTAGFQAAARSVRFRPDVTTPPSPLPAARQRVPPGFGGGRGASQAAAAEGGRLGVPFTHRMICVHWRVGFRPAATPVCEVTDSGQGGFRVSGRGGGRAARAGFRETPSKRASVSGCSPGNVGLAPDLTSPALR